MNTNPVLEEKESVSHRCTTRQALQIVIAWTEQSAEFVEQIYIGGGEYKNVFKDIIIPKACIWLNDGRQSDVAKAREYARSEIPGAKVFTYKGESDPLTKAKQDILKSSPKI